MREFSPRTQKILVVDDDRGNRTLMQALLERQGHVTLQADSERQALALFRRHQKTIVLVVTGLNSPEFGRYLQRLKPNLPVLVVSACRGQFDEALEGFACLSKPFTIRELVGRVSELLPQRKGMAKERAARRRHLKSG